MSEHNQMTGIFDGYEDNSAERDATGKGKPDKIHLTENGLKRKVTVWSEKGQKIVDRTKIGELAKASKGDTISFTVSVSEYVSQRDGKTYPDYTLCRDQPVTITPTPKTGLAGYSAPQPKEDYWAKRAEQDAKTQTRIGAQWAINAAIETLKLAYPEGAVGQTSEQVLTAIEAGATKLQAMAKKLADVELRDAVSVEKEAKE